MKLYINLLLLVLFTYPFHVLGQNSLFTEFNIEAEQVIQYLQKNGEMDYKKVSDKSLIVNQGENLFEYQFNDNGTLYQTTLKREFNTRDQAMEYYNSLSDFHTRIHGNMNNEVMSEDKIKKVVKRGSMINELHLLKNVDRKYTVKLIRKDSDFSPEKNPSHSYVD